ncbi:putative thiol peroxidase [Sporosarcina sp. NCCP-2716]|uniref:thiol peroxidase n=1 Tax=Sporosarcina sp. NCCP-2716 TaxID=2943679 RepID=UPI002040E4AB|nr:thiol peroxidase [Sporosarcina sp. NCCP-2716]GKV69566.1 putative thiol peroxidase [Sporosarcina sp. NCCP-2716]
MTTVTFQNKPVTLLGSRLKAGDKAAGFTVIGNDLLPVTFDATDGKIRLISVVPSIDTGVCSKQTQRFNEEAGELGDEVEVTTISADLPFAQARYRSAEEIGNMQILSDHRDLSFGKAYGVVIEELRLLARAIFVIDQTGTVVYSEYVSEVTDHPDYMEALDAVNRLKA